MSVDNRFRNAEAETGSTGLSIVETSIAELFENLPLTPLIAFVGCGDAAGVGIGSG